ncbi:glycosyltransferase family 2 protein [Mycolicibacterium rhodesiae]|uniref:Sugar transferase n=1 Tax=Mycolicibacterium rhodesiae TaxID=36814 RepID=A0A1X0IU55_MYCRH|nr:galactosyltransferase-related protein [Mycolicibacterium rhodesiae]MCV7345972.1 glycosyltransferase family 2 protein [Mycolicibacterium rhodesiae]ORB52277.1 sugar transferase [Mycolicibacterium rhodesiae]
MKTAVITTAHGRHDHLRRQLEGISRSVTQPDVHVVVAMCDDAIAPLVTERSDIGRTVQMAVPAERLPLAAARNLGADTAIADGATLLVFLDVDCIPGPHMLDAYRRAAADPLHTDALLCGPVTYLSPPGPGGYDLEALPGAANPHPGRPAPQPNEVLVTAEYEYFWSLSFALTARTWSEIGGFCTAYSGYGGEDTDFAQVAASRDIGMRWVGGADAFHQYHPVSEPPVEHLDDIALNANIFRERWGWWPMRGWLEEFTARGLITWRGDQLVVTSVAR